VIFDNPDTRNIKTAAQWYFDSLSQGKSTTSFILASIAMECLYGESDSKSDLSIGALISNRFAYSTCTTERMRKSKIKSFKDIYAIRSKIVHSGKNTLIEKEMNDLKTLKLYCTQSILSESKLHG
jgi:hypothetical protein